MASCDGPVDASTPEAVPIRRSRAGCWTCRSKTVKKRCDQQRPVCGRCSRLKLSCDYSRRPTLAERRRAQEAEPTQIAIRPARDHASSPAASPVASPAACEQSLISDQSITILKKPLPAACNLTLEDSDHEAIRYFCTEFGKSHHVRHNKFSLISLMSKIANDNPMVMEMVIALGLQEMNFRRPTQTAKARQDSLQRYASSLHRLAESIGPENGKMHSDAIYTTLWMMLIYEQQFGDAQCMAYMHHLQGFSSILRHSVTNKAVDDSDPSITPLSHLSIYSARLFVWIAHLDAAAASFGIRGGVNSAILNYLQKDHQKLLAPPTDSIRAFTLFHRGSVPLYRRVWGAEYPEDEIRDDAFSFLSACVQLRHQTAHLATLYQDDHILASQKSVEVKASIDHVRRDYEGLIELTSSLSLATNVNQQLRAILRSVVPFYFAVYLDFMRVTEFMEPLNELQRHALQEMLNIIYQSHEENGDEAMNKVAWPLFIAAMETDDLIHQEWILERFEKLSKFGQNFERACQFLTEIIPLQRAQGQRIDLLRELSMRAKFVLA